MTAEPSGASLDWGFVRRSEYSLPGPATEAARTLQGAWKRLRRRFRAGARRNDQAMVAELYRPKADVVAELLPRLDLEAAAAALAEVLADEAGGDPSAPACRVVVGPPGSHVAEILDEVARGEEWVRLEPPPGREIVNQPDRVRQRLEALDAGTPAVICRLERWFVRNEVALSVMKLVVDGLRAHQGRLLVGCDSWTWAFLDRAIGIEGLLGEPLAPAPFDGARLAAWLGEPFRSERLVCRRSGSREEVFGRPADGEADSAGQRRGPSRLLAELASEARGNPGVALELWRRSLRSGEAGGEDLDLPPAERERAWWAVAPSESEIDVPGELDGLHRFVAHASLLHGGLPFELVGDALPFPRQDVVRRVTDLQALGLAHERGAELVVAPAAYVGMRRHLAARGFLVDGF